MRVVAIIQARMGSSRLSGKMLLHIAGKPLIWHLVHRLQQCSTLDEIVLATTTNTEDDPLAVFGEEAGLKVSRGADWDVLGRFGLAAEASGADVIVRVNGDAPLIDPGFIDAQVTALQKQDADFVSLAQGIPCIHDGVDAMSRRALDYMLAEARKDPVAIEHVTGYIKLNPDKFQIGRFEIPESLQWDGARLSIDTPADLVFMERLYEELQVTAGEARLADVSRLLQERPDLVALNAHVQQKEMTATHGTVLIRTDGGGSLGLGHVMRTLAVAEVLRDEIGYGVIFAMDARARLADGVAIVEERGFHVKRQPEMRRSGDSEAGWLMAICQELKPGSVLFDIRTDLSADDVTNIRNQVSKIVTLDDGSDRRLVADVAVFPPVPQVHQMDWSQARGKMIADWDHVVLSAGASHRQSQTIKTDQSTKLFVNFGGSDPFELTLPAAQMLSKFDKSLDVTFVIGPGVAGSERLAEGVRRCSKRFTVEIAPEDFAGMAAGHGLALIAFGVTAYELARLGVPSVLVCLNEDQFASAAPFEAEGIGARVLMSAAGQIPDIADTLKTWLKDPDKRQKAADRAASLVDGKGAHRVASTMLWGQTLNS